jgi:hypothetical protein
MIHALSSDCGNTKGAPPRYRVAPLEGGGTGNAGNEPAALTTQTSRQKVLLPRMPMAGAGALCRWIRMMGLLKDLGPYGCDNCALRPRKQTQRFTAK